MRFCEGTSEICGTVGHASTGTLAVEDRPRGHPFGQGRNLPRVHHILFLWNLLTTSANARSRLYTRNAYRPFNVLDVKAQRRNKLASSLYIHMIVRHPDPRGNHGSESVVNYGNSE